MGVAWSYCRRNPQLVLIVGLLLVGSSTARAQNKIPVPADLQQFAQKAESALKDKDNTAKTGAARLGLTRQQVINLRMSARKRLSNRISGRS